MKLVKQTKGYVVMVIDAKWAMKCEFKTLIDMAREEAPIATAGDVLFGIGKENKDRLYIKLKKVA